jgi:hypothetical protein
MREARDQKRRREGGREWGGGEGKRRRDGWGREGGREGGREQKRELPEGVERPRAAS